ncbi:MAG: YeiH family protein [Clostridiales bacterium]|jgi:uncharacterized integral membrane protein (TIGR00698 family)|nr:YeiH family protein [Clostridiales bacterium]
MMVIVYVLAGLLLTLPIATPSFYKKGNWAGALVCAGLAVPAWFIGEAVPVAGGPVVGILLGLIITNIWKKKGIFAPGIKAASKRVLQMAIVLFGFQMNFNNVVEMGGSAVILILSVISVAFIVAVFLGRVLKVPFNEKTLIGVGTAICGGSAIAATAPVLEAGEKEVVRAISTIFLFNIIAAFLYPALGRFFGMSDTAFGMWAGSAINDTSSVVAAGYAFSDAAGTTATVVKLTRTIMIIPVTLIIALTRAGTREKGRGVNILGTFPWFVLAFLLASVINTTGFIPAEAAAFWSRMGKFLIVAAMVAIGFGCDVKELIKGGRKPIILGFCCSVCVAAVSYLINAFGINT